MTEFRSLMDEHLDAHWRKFRSVREECGSERGFFQHLRSQEMPCRPCTKALRKMLRMTPGQIAEWGKVQASLLSCLVRDEGRDAITEQLRRYDRHQLEAVAVVLACMVPEDRSVGDLLAWIEQPYTVGDIDAETRQMRDLHAAFVRAKVAGREPTAVEREGERRYQAARKRKQRSRQVAA